MPQGATMTSRANRDAHEAMKKAISARYILSTEIARGELTLLYIARPRGGTAGLTRPVAVKCLKPEFSLSPEGIRLLRQEAWVSLQLHHAHLTRCIEVVETDDSCCLVQNYIEGVNLSQLLQSESHKAPERYIIPLLVDVLEGLHAMHTALDDQGWPLLLRHGGMRAGHVLVGTDGIARLTDFSQAQSVRTSVSGETRNRPIQARFMAPEQALAPETTDHRSDIFLAGVLLWEALTGTELFAAKSEKQRLHHLAHRPIPPPSKADSRASACFDEVCLRALQRDPNKRYASALDMACALRDAALHADLCASRTDIGKWVQSISLASEASDDEPTARFVRPYYSDMREIKPAPNAVSSAADVEAVTGEFLHRVPGSRRIHAS